MCIVVDACTFASVFKEHSKDHSSFRPVLIWIIKGKGKLVYGGTTYKNELRQAHTYLKLFTQLDKAGKIKQIDDIKVDNFQKEIETNVGSPINDVHLIAIIGISGCRLICTIDKKAINPYLKCSDLYPPGVHRPKIFTGNKNNDRLLCDSNIAPVCNPVNKGSRELCELFGV